MSAAVDAAAAIHAKWHGRTYGEGAPDDVADAMVAKMMLGAAAKATDPGLHRLAAAIVGQEAVDRLDAAEAMASRLAAALRGTMHIAYRAIGDRVCGRCGHAWPCVSADAREILAEWDASHAGTVTG